MPGKDVGQVASSVLHSGGKATVDSQPLANTFASGVDLYDMHCHCLPGVDDGPATMDEAVALCRLLVADGCLAAVATPHHLGRYDHPGHTVRVRTVHAELQLRLKQQRIPLQIYLGAETRLDERIPSLLPAKELLPLGVDSNHLLIELPDALRIDPAPLIHRLKEMGFVAIVAHPERYRFVAEQPGIVQRWITAGAMIQVTAASLLGEFGRAAEAASWHMLEHNLVHFVASDAHDSRRRAPCLSRAYAAISAQLSTVTAQRVCSSNPKLLMTGQQTQRGWRNTASIIDAETIRASSRPAESANRGREIR